ncbi:hypothetical protein AEAC466_02135 [Asticcacaulis sp. AC466]|uniref:flagellar hook-associated protein FlgK n=1 Tax=Asticcacaulis sp. AC466 TaxID=1282362 RepID=UPI0003C3F3BA|nr:flagellar hook-associated protein FlgK [Asticcacaulis sp. AC466]ESQ86006.1 hypothetical protein AEAC466_02135 [Asticcacaulis sp. AC466]
MSLNSIMNIGVSGLMTAQDQLRIVSDNMANVNTPGYIRKVSQQQSLVTGGVGMGVTSGKVTLAADQFLQAAALKATSASSQSEATYELLDQIQSQFGDITDTNNLFNQGSATLSAFASLGEDPTSAAGRQQALSNLSSFLSEGNRISTKIQTIRGDADTRIGTDVSSVNDLLKNISQLNSTISSTTVVGGDATGAQTTQASYISQLSKLLDVKVSQNANGGVTLRTQTGMLLTDGGAYATLSYTPAAGVDATTSFGPITVNGINGETRDLADNLSSGEIKGLLDIRDNTAPAVNSQLNEYVNQFAAQVNAAHNASSSAPAPASLTGKNTSLSEQEAIAGFTGKTTITTLSSTGNITHTLQIDFSTNQYTYDGGAAAGFDPTNFVNDINGALGGAATLNFSNGAMSVTAAGSGGNDGVAIVDDATTPSNKQGQGFSQFFGLNDLVTSDVPTRYNTGLGGSDNHGFTAGSVVNFAVKSGAGSALATVNFQVPSGSTMQNLLDGLNDTTTGMGKYGVFSLDASGTLSFSGYGNPATTLSVSGDDTKRYGTGASLSQFFGLSDTAGTLASHLTVAQTVLNDPSKLALAHVNLSAAGGTGALNKADGAGGLSLAAVANTSVTFNKAGLNSGGTSTLQRYGSDLAGQVGNLAATAKSSKDSNAALLSEASNRLDSAQGVNLDEELVNLTTFQQAYSASGRLIQAAKDMYDTLLNMVK